VAADALVGAFRDLGHEVIPLPDEVWDLSSLADGEALSFAQSVLASILEHHNLRVGVGEEHATARLAMIPNAEVGRREHVTHRIAP
jgi:hypothetical protein